MPPGVVRAYIRHSVGLHEDGKDMSLDAGGIGNLEIGEKRGEQRGMQKMLNIIKDAAKKAGVSEEIEKLVNDCADQKNSKEGCSRRETRKNDGY